MCCPFHRWQLAREDTFLIYVVKNNFVSLCWLCNTECTCRQSASQSTEYHSTVHEGSIRGEKALFTLLFLHFQQVFGIQTSNLTVTCLDFLECVAHQGGFLFLFFTPFLRVPVSPQCYLSWNLFRPVSPPLAIKRCSGYVTVSFSVLFFQINYASVWHRGFGAKTNSSSVMSWLHGSTRRRAFANAEQTLQGQRERHSQYCQVIRLWNIRIYSNSPAWSWGLRMF